MTLKNSTHASTTQQLPELNILEISPNGVLDLTTFQGDATITCEKWNASRVWLKIVGEKNPGETYTIPILTNHLLSASEFSDGLSEITSRDELMNFANNSQISVVGKINFDGSPDESNATTFPELQLKIKTKDTSLDDFTDFNDRSLGGWTKGSAGREIQFVSGDSSGNYHLFNNTSEQLDNHSGIVLEKSFSVSSAQRYEFTIGVKKENQGSPNPPNLVLKIDDNRSQTHVINNMNWSTYSFTATATSNTMIVSLLNLEARWNGNDFSLDNFRVRSLL
jgi:hypothetical protein